MLTAELLRRLPKAELHVHLDGSLRPSTMIDLASRSGVDLPTREPEQLRRLMLVKDGASLEDYLRRFELTIALLQTPDAIERAAYEMVEDAAADGVRLLEVRYCPELSTRQGLGVDEAIAAEWRGLARGERDFGVRTAIINCSLRHYDPAVSLHIARCSVAARQHGVVGFDLAGGEYGRPAGAHQAAFDAALAGGLGITVHAGEAAGAESVADAVRTCHANRIGHGTRLFEDAGLQDYVRDRRILVEINLTSNLQTGAVARLADHPVRRYFDAGLNVTLCTDSWLMSGTTQSREYELAHTELGFSRAEIDRMILNGFCLLVPALARSAGAAGPGENRIDGPRVSGTEALPSAVDAVRARLDGRAPEIAIVLGSGLGCARRAAHGRGSDLLCRHPGLPRADGAGPPRRAGRRHACRTPGRGPERPLPSLRGSHRRCHGAAGPGLRRAGHHHASSPRTPQAASGGASAPGR